MDKKVKPFTESTDALFADVSHSVIYDEEEFADNCRKANKFGR